MTDFAFSVPVNLALLGVLMFGGIARRRVFLYLGAFVLSLNALSFEYYVLWTWQRLLLPVGLLVATARGEVDFGRVRTSRRSFVAFLGYMAAVTALCWAFLDVDGALARQARYYGWGPAQVDYRHLVQLYSYLSNWGLVPIAFFLVRDKKDLGSVCNGLVSGSVFSALVGAYQVLSTKFGLPWIDVSPSGLLDQARAQAAVPLETGGSFVRLWGLAGEPKHTAALTLVAIAAILSVHFFDREGVVTIPRARAKLVVLLVALFATGSTGGFIAAAAMATAWLVLVTCMPRVAGSVRNGIPVFVAVVVLAVAVGGGYVASVYETRVAGRLDFASPLDRLAAFEPKDAALLNFALASPGAVVFGRGTGGVDFELIPYTPPHFLNYGGTITPAYFITRTLGDLGIVGLFLVSLVVGQWLVHTRKCGGGHSFIVLGAVALGLASQACLPAFLLLGAGWVAYVDTHGWRGNVNRAAVAWPGYAASAATTAGETEGQSRPLRGGEQQSQEPTGARPCSEKGLRLNSAPIPAARWRA